MEWVSVNLPEEIKDSLVWPGPQSACLYNGANMPVGMQSVSSHQPVQLDEIKQKQLSGPCCMQIALRAVSFLPWKPIFTEVR